MLFRSPLLSQKNAPVLMEAFHSRFTPAFDLFRTLVDRTYLFVPYSIEPLQSVQGGVVKGVASKSTSQKSIK